jgi:hypothetical protein
MEMPTKIVLMGLNNNNTSGNKIQIANVMIVNAAEEINGTFSLGDNFHVTASNTSIGSPVDKGLPIDMEDLRSIADIGTDSNGISTRRAKSCGR